MAEITGKIKTSTNGLAESFGMAILKVGSEAVLRPIVGDATIKSGLVKLVIGAGASYALPAGSLRRMATSAFVVDGMEDMVYGSGVGAILGGIFGGKRALPSGTGSGTGGMIVYAM